MAIEGPLRELGIHDVFQLLDLSRKTGALRVSSELREDEGVVFFDGGRIVQASIRSTAIPTEVALLQAGRITDADIARARGRQENGGASRDIVDLLVETGAITERELERQLRLRIKSVVFELMSWREGFFSFEERSRSEMPLDTRITVTTGSLLMEAARRIDEWSRIADIIPNLAIVPELAPIREAGEPRDGGATLDLLPHEWQVLTMIDGERDLRAIAASLGRDEFEIAKIAYGLATIDIISLRVPMRTTAEFAVASAEIRRASARVHTLAGRHAEAVEELRHALQEDPLTATLHLDHAFAAARAGDLASARAGWEHFLRLAPDDASADRVRNALDAAQRFQRILEEDTDG